MKRLDHVWDSVLDENNAVDAIRDAIAYKKQHKKVRELLLNDDGTLNVDKTRAYGRYLIEKLRTKSWHHKSPRFKKTYCRNKTHGGGKWRGLYIPSLEDHCIHHMVMQAAMPAFTKGMHPFSCGSVPDRGIKLANQAISRWLKDKNECTYFVKLDIRHFFDSISKEDLKKVIRRHIKDENLLWALDEIIDSAPSACPIGYYPSPWFANLLLQDLDWMIEQKLFKPRRGKRIKYVKHYVRYMDDMLLIGTSKSDLHKAVKAIKKYLLDNLSLEIKNTWEIKRIAIFENKKLKKGTYWIDMCGYKFCHGRTILRDNIFIAARRLAKKIFKKEYATLHEMMSMLSRIGWSKMSNNVKFLEEYIKPYVNIKKLRRNISNVDKKRKQRSVKTCRD